MVGKIGDRARQPFLIPAIVALRTKENGALIVIDPFDGKAQLAKELAGFRPDQTG